MNSKNLVEPVAPTCVVQVLNPDPLSHQYEIPDSLVDEIISLQNESRALFQKGSTLEQTRVMIEGESAAYGLIKKWVDDFYNQRPKTSFPSSPEFVRVCKRKNQVSPLCSFPQKKRRLSLMGAKERLRGQRAAAASWKKMILKWMEQDMECCEGYRSILSRLSFKAHDSLGSALEVMAFINRNGLNGAKRKQKRCSIISASSSQDLPISVLKKLLTTATQNLKTVDEMASFIDPDYPKKVLGQNYDPYQSWYKWTKKRANLRTLALFNRTSPFAFRTLSQGEKWEKVVLDKRISWVEIVLEFLMRNRI